MVQGEEFEESKANSPSAREIRPQGGWGEQTAQLTSLNWMGCSQAAPKQSFSIAKQLLCNKTHRKQQEQNHSMSWAASHTQQEAFCRSTGTRGLRPTRVGEADLRRTKQTQPALLGSHVSSPSLGKAGRLPSSCTAQDSRDADIFWR